MLKLFSPQSFEMMSDTTGMTINLPHEQTQKPVPAWEALTTPLAGILACIEPVPNAANHPIEFTFSDQLHSLIYFHVEEYTSARALFEDLNEKQLPPVSKLPCGQIRRGTFSDAINTRGLDPMLQVFNGLSHKASKVIGNQCPQLGRLCALDGSLIAATLSMEWADYTKTTHKAKVHLGFSLNNRIPTRVHLTDGKGAERPVAADQIQAGETGVMDRGYQDHRQFDAWQEAGQHFVCRVRRNTQFLLINHLPTDPSAGIYFHAEVYLGDDAHRTHYPVRLIGLRRGRKHLLIVTSRTDLSAEQIATKNRFRWQIETFFAGWKRHLNVYHLIARSQHGVFMQLLAGLCSYLLLAIYCFKRTGQLPSITQLRQLRQTLRKERVLSAEPAFASNRTVAVLMVARWGPLPEVAWLLAVT